MAFMGMGMNAVGGMMQGMSQPATASANPFIQTNSQPASQSQTTTQEDPYAKLSELKKLLDNGVITEADFDAAKKKLLGI